MQRPFTHSLPHRGGQREEVFLTCISGIDPGSRHTGFAFFKIHQRHIVSASYGVIQTNPKEPFIDRMLFIGKQLKELFDKYNPKILVTEKVFFGKNAQSAFKLGYAQCVCTYIAAERGIQLFEYSTKEVKKTLTGSGCSRKEQVQKMVLRLLGQEMSPKISLDASDAMALAYHHFLIWKNQHRMGRINKMNEMDKVGEMDKRNRRNKTDRRGEAKETKKVSEVNTVSTVSKGRKGSKVKEVNKMNKVGTVNEKKSYGGEFTL